MVEVSVILPVYNEERNLAVLAPLLKDALLSYVDSFEIIVVDADSENKRAELYKDLGVQVLFQKQKGFGAAIKEGIRASCGRYILTMDLDNSHPPEFVRQLLSSRKDADLIIGSRFIKGAIFHTSIWRKMLSSTLNKIIKSVFSLSVNDSTSGFRIYRREILKDIYIKSSNFDIQLELLIKILFQGYQVKEIPLEYRKRLYGRSKASIIGCGIAFLKTGFRMYRFRSSTFS